MKQILVTITFIITALSGFSQTVNTPSYGPVPYRTPEQTIGEDYTPPPPPLKKYTWAASLNFADNYEKVLYKDVLNKKFKLVKIENGKTGYFMGEDGKEYKTNIGDDGHFFGMFSVKDLEMSRAMFLNKTLWIKNYNAQVYHDKDDKYKDTLISTLQPITVKDISIGRHSDLPLVFTVRTRTGNIACYGIDLSGPDNLRQSKYFVENNFYLKDPKLTYHFSTAVWRQIEAGETPIGMVTDAFELVMGRPTKVNRSRTGNTIREQWVYGEDSPRFYYFTNDKYTGNN